MKSFKVPEKQASASFTEKHSRFIGNIFKVEQAEQAQEILKSMQKRFWDASHNVYAYVLQNGVMRFSDDGEPGGTAGMPTLEVLRREEVTNVLCVTTRYFGGTLLGAGGLTRAYAKAAKMALDEAGIAVMMPFSIARVNCHYRWLDVLRKQYEHFEASEESADFGSEISIMLALPEERFQDFCDKIFDFTSGEIKPILEKQDMRAKKLV